MWRKWLWQRKRHLVDWLIRQQRKQAALQLRTGSSPEGELCWLERPAAAGAPTLVMVHGFGADKRHWLRFAREIPAQYRVLIPDLAGHGDSVSNLSLDYRIPAQAARLQHWLESLQLDRVHLMGNSMGGALCLQLAANQSIAVQSLTLLDSLGPQVSDSEMAILWRTQDINPLLSMDTVQGVRDVMGWTMHHVPYLPKFVLEVEAENKKARLPVEEKIFADLLVSWEHSIDLSAIQVPTLIIWGKQDRVLHVDDASTLHEQIANSEKVILPNTGHLPMLEQPHKVGELWRDFVRRHPHVTVV